MIGWVDSQPKKRRNEMGKVSKEGYARKREWRARHNDETMMSDLESDNPIMSESEHESIQTLHSLRHNLHTGSLQNDLKDLEEHVESMNFENSEIQKLKQKCLGSISLESIIFWSHDEFYCPIYPDDEDKKKIEKHEKNLEGFGGCCYLSINDIRELEGELEEFLNSENYEAYNRILKSIENYQIENLNSMVRDFIEILGTRFGIEY